MIRNAGVSDVLVGQAVGSSEAESLDRGASKFVYEGYTCFTRNDT